MWARHSRKLAMRGASPPGCRLRRSTFTGGCNSFASAPASSGATARLAKTRFQWRSTASAGRSEEHTSELQSLMRISYAVFCLKKKKETKNNLKSAEKYEQRAGKHEQRTKNMRRGHYKTT